MKTNTLKKLKTIVLIIDIIVSLIEIAIGIINLKNSNTDKAQ